MNHVWGLPVADGAEPAVMHFDTPPPTFAKDIAQKEWLLGYRQWYAAKASLFVDALQEHAPQGFVDHVFAELAKRKASLLRVR
jgi:hypothetical protein